MHFLSFELLIYKINTMKTLIYQAYHLNSNYLNSNYLKFHLEKNIYKLFFFGSPSNLFFKYVNQFLDKQQEDKLKILSAQKMLLCISFPYYGYISEKVRYELNDIVYRIFHKYILSLCLEIDV